MSKHAQAAANGGKHPRVGAGTDMGEVDPSLYSTDPSLPAGMWTCAPKPRPKRRPTEEDLFRRKDDHLDEMDRLRGRGPSFAASLAAGLAYIGNVERMR